MKRGLPISLLVHVLAVVLVFVFGNRVSRPPIELPHSLDLEFALVSLPTAEQPVEAEPEPEPEPPMPEPEVSEEPVVVPEKPEDVPVEKVPEQEPEPVKKSVEKEPQPSQDLPADTQERETEPKPAVPALTGLGVAGTDVDFPFAYYLGIVKTRISRHFNPTRLGFRDGAVITCVLHFSIARNGTISQITVQRSSGIDVFDREARRAVLAAHPLPKLPPKYSASTLGITFVFNQESGL